MERQIRDIISRVDRLSERIDTLTEDERRADLNAIRMALKGMLSVWQARASRRPGGLLT
jgi:hypothetical protein